MDTVDDSSGEATSDAGKRDVSSNAAADAGARDARVERADARVEPEEPEEEEPVEEPEPLDAGKADAGKADAGKSDAGTGGTSPKPDAGAPASTCDTLTYTSFGQSFLSTYCVSCHGATVSQKNIRLDSLAGVQATKAKVKSEVASGSMPPKGAKAPSAAERTKLGEWITCGPK